MLDLLVPPGRFRIGGILQISRIWPSNVSRRGTSLGKERVFSVVCVYNNRQILTDYLLQSLQQQDAEYELILVDNTQGLYESAAKALNWGARDAGGQYLMFVHQDVRLSSPSWLSDAEQMLDQIPDLGMAGPLGVRGDMRGRRRLVTNVTYGVPAAELPNALQVAGPEQVQTVDELLLIVPNSVFHRLQFDESVCDDWHFYGVDYCLSAAELGFNAYALPLPTHHRHLGIDNTNLFRIILGMGLFAPGYYRTLGRMLNKHRRRFAKVYAGTGEWDARYPLMLQRFVATIDAIVSIYARPCLHRSVTKLRRRQIGTHAHD